MVKQARKFTQKCELVETQLEGLKTAKKGMESYGEIIEYRARRTGYLILFLLLLLPLRKKMREILLHEDAHTGDKHVAQKASEADNHLYKNNLVLQERINKLIDIIKKLMKHIPQTTTEAQKDFTEIEAATKEYGEIVGQIPKDENSNN